MSGSDEWRAGDDALCIDDRPPRFFPEAHRVERGKHYKVHSVRVTSRGSVALYIGIGTSVTPEGYPRGWDARRFVKVTPPEADEFDREVIKLLTSKPAQVSS